MTKKSKIIIIAVSVVVFVAVVLGVLYWGLQPVQKDEVTLEKLNSKLGAMYCMPSELPFEGDVQCYIVYVMGHSGVVLTRFEASPKRSTGYLIDLKDDKRAINIETGDSIAITSEGAESLITDNYNGQEIGYLYSQTETDNVLTILFDIDDNTYYIKARYNQDVDSQTLKSDVECILNQMIKQ